MVGGHDEKTDFLAFQLPLSAELCRPHGMGFAASRWVAESLSNGSRE